MEQTWEVVVADLHDRGDPSNGVHETSLVRGPEAEARRVYADTVAQASEPGHEYVKLRCAGRDVECWPLETGWTV